MTAPANRVADLLGHLPPEADDIVDNAIEELAAGRLFGSEIRTLMNAELAELGIPPVLRSTFNRWIMQGELHGFQKRQPGAQRVQLPSALKRFWARHELPAGFTDAAPKPVPAGSRPQVSTASKLIDASAQKKREFLESLLVQSGKTIKLPLALFELFDDLEDQGRNALHFVADHLGREGALRIFMTLFLAFPDLVLKALNDGEGGRAG